MNAPGPEKRRRLIISASVAGAVLFLISVRFGIPYLVGPPVPRTITIAAGMRSGVYYSVAQRYRDVLQTHGIELRLLETNGAVENLQRLKDHDATLAIIQGGTGTRDEHVGLSSLASLYLEPVWIFHRMDSGVLDQLADLRGSRIAIGPVGSGTHTIAAEWLSENGFELSPEQTAEQTLADGTVLLPIMGEAAADALEAHKIDAAFMVTGAESPVVSRLMRVESIELMSLRRAAAYETRYRYLKTVTFAEGMLDLRQNLPEQNVTMLATTASLVANDDLHPALIQLLLEAAHDVHFTGGFFEAPREFPSPIGVDIAINPNAKRYFRDGPSFLYRYLPFRYANWLDRMKLLIAPMLMLLVPLFKFFPPLYRYGIRRRIYRWYRILREIDQKLKQHEDDNVDFSPDILRLKSLETELAQVSVPLSYMEEFYNLRLHVNYVLGLLKDRYLPDDD
jgi:TRAP transporter TAXI family solute receptor